MIKFKKDFLLISVLTGLVVVFAIVINIYKTRLEIKTANYNPGKLIKPIKYKIDKSFWQFLESQTQSLDKGLIYNPNIQPKRIKEAIPKIQLNQATKSGQPTRQPASPSGQTGQVAPSKNKS